MSNLKTERKRNKKEMELQNGRNTIPRNSQGQPGLLSHKTMIARCADYPVRIALGRQAQENQEFKSSLGYVGSLRPAWLQRGPLR